MAQTEQEIENNQSEDTNTSEQTDNSETLGNSDVINALMKLPKTSSDNILSHVNVDDFFPKKSKKTQGTLRYNSVDASNLSGETGDLGASYFPSQQLSPVGVAGTPGGPVIITGGQNLLPYGVRDARLKALQVAALQSQIDQQKQNQQNRQEFVLGQGAPQLQDQWIKDYSENISNAYDDYIAKHGKEGISTWDSSPEHRAVQQHYLELENAVYGSKMLNDAYSKQFSAAQKEGKVFSAATKNLMNNYWEGKDEQGNPLTVNGVNNMQRVLPTYLTLDTKIEKMAPLLHLDKVVSNYFQNGIPLNDKNGNPTGKRLYANDGINFINEVKAHGIPDNQVDAMATSIMKSGDLPPELSDPKNKQAFDAVKNHIRETLPQYVENVLHQYKPDKPEKGEKEDIPPLLPGIVKVEGGGTGGAPAAPAGTYYPVDTKKFGKQYVEEVPSPKLDKDDNPVKNPDGSAQYVYEKQLLKGVIAHEGKLYKVYQGDLDPQEEGGINFKSVIKEDREVDDKWGLLKQSAPAPVSAPAAPVTNLKPIGGL